MLHMYPKGELVRPALVKGVGADYHRSLPDVGHRGGEEGRESDPMLKLCPEHHLTEAMPLKGGVRVGGENWCEEGVLFLTL